MEDQYQNGQNYPLTVRYNHKSWDGILITDVIVYNQDNIEVHTKALWDTGSNKCSIRESLVSKLNLPYKRMANMVDISRKAQSNVYIGNIRLSNGLFISNIELSTFSIETSFDLIIGLEVIINMDFSLTRCEDETVFSIRFPSLNIIDYEKQ